MKKHYEAPTVEKITFNYRDQVVAASAGGEESSWYQQAIDDFYRSPVLQEIHGTISNFLDWLRDQIN